MYVFYLSFLFNFILNEGEDNNLLYGDNNIFVFILSIFQGCNYIVSLISLYFAEITMLFQKRILYLQKNFCCDSYKI